MCGIFAHIIHGVEKERSELIRILLNGLHRLEYRGYDSAGLACDGKVREKSSWSGRECFSKRIADGGYGQGGKNPQENEFDAVKNTDVLVWFCCWVCISFHVELY